MQKIRRLPAFLNPWRLKRNRRGYTLLEAVLTLALASILVLGLGILVLSIREQMWVCGQLRAAEEWGQEYSTVWSRVVRNAATTHLRRLGPPSELVCEAVPPDQPINKDYLEEFIFRYHSRDKVPALYVRNRRTWLFYNDGQRKHASWPPGNEMDPRESFVVLGNGRDGFRISRCDYAGIPNKFRSHFLTLEFTLVYTRLSNVPGSSLFVRQIPFKASAYTVNPNWPVNYLESKFAEIPDE